jgi:glyoxylase-like metal-dependent hydrolase (beta-lactamase superfamily II)
MGHGEPWDEIADGVLVRRHRRLDLNVGLVVGGERCLVVDTRESHAQAHDLVEAIRRVTDLPWVVVNTHAHYDHVFGNHVFTPSVIWGHDRCAEVVERYGEIQRALVQRALAEHGEEALAAELAEVEITPPNRTFADAVTVDLGGVRVDLRHLGRGHTDNDVVVHVPGGALFAGDLVEEGAPPAVDDAFPLDWPSTLDALLALVDGPVVPGHGAVVDRGFVEEQAAVLTATAVAAREAFAEGRRPEEAASTVPLPEQVAVTALTRAFRQLRGEPPYEPPDELRDRFGLT